MNSHLNLFRFFSESENEKMIENNLTRALILTLKNDELFFKNFIKLIIKDYKIDEFYEYEKVYLDTQVNTKNIKNYNKIFPVTLTTEEIKFTGNCNEIKENAILDLIIGINKVLIVVEVKRNNKNCESQLIDQINKIVSNFDNLIEISYYTSLTWAKIVNIAINSKESNLVSGIKNPYIEDFIEFLYIYYPEWFPIKKLEYIEFPKNNNCREYDELEKRLIQIKNGVSEDNELIEIGSRGAIPIKEKWAKEINILIDLETKTLNLGIWAGSTKEQAFYLFLEKESLELLRKDNIEINYEGIKIKYEINPYLKFSSFSKRIFGYNFKKNQYHLFNKNLFEKIAGKWKKEEWDELRIILKNIIDLYEYPEWKKYIEKSNRTQVDITTGIEFLMKLNYEDLQKYDTDENNQIINVFKKIIKKMINEIR